MNISQHPSKDDTDEASRLAVTATAADLEDWARSVADHGQVDLHDLVHVLNILRADSVPQHSSPALFPALAAS